MGREGEEEDNTLGFHYHTQESFWRKTLNVSPEVSVVLLNELVQKNRALFGQGDPMGICHLMEMFDNLLENILLSSLYDKATFLREKT